jgi:hypothetical protein
MMDNGYNDHICLGVDASGSRCGLALVGMGTCRPKHLIWQTTVHSDKSPNMFISAVRTRAALIDAMIIGRNYVFPTLVAIEDPTGFAYATALHHTNRTTNAAAVFGFSWMIALSMVAFDAVFGITKPWDGVAPDGPIYKFQPSQWQARIGANQFYPMGDVKEKLRLVMDDKYPEKNRKHIVRGVVATLLNAPELVEVRQLRSKRWDWVVEQDGVDAAGIAIVGLEERTVGNPKAAPKKGTSQRGGKGKAASRSISCTPLPSVVTPLQ